MLCGQPALAGRRTHFSADWYTFILAFIGKAALKSEKFPEAID
jgi:hypothetical protein